MTDIALLREIIRKELEEAVKAVFYSGVGINDKTGENTLKDSNLCKEAEVTDDGDFNIFLNFYYQFVESGRRAGAKPPPVNALVNWARRKGIDTSNRTIYAIRAAIVRDGIHPRPIIEAMEQEIDERFENKIFDKIINGIIADLEEIWQ